MPKLDYFKSISDQIMFVNFLFDLDETFADFPFVTEIIFKSTRKF